jgi:hypothetical protein
MPQRILLKAMIRKALLFFIIPCCSGFPGQLFSQELEYGGWAGVANYFGDINSNASFEFLGPAGGLFFRYNLGTRFSFKNGLNYGRVGFHDDVSDFPYQQARNLSFKSDIFEFSSHVEFNFFKYDREKKHLSFTPYLLVGVSVFYFNPKTEYEGDIYALQPLQTEGKSYSRVSFGVPIGGGFKYSFSPYWAIGIEGGLRKTFTDYVDDVSTVYPGGLNDGTLSASLSDRSGEVTDPSIGFEGKQRGFAERNDDFLFMGVSISYSPIKVKCPKPSRIIP